jgi:Secretory lipase
VRAARELPGAGISASAPTIAWGYSQGGQAVGWAGELQPTYAPDVKLVGVAAGGVPGNLQALAEFGNGSVGAGFALDAIVGLNAAYPGEFNLESFSNQAGIEAIAKAKSECAIQTLAEFNDAEVSTYTAGHKTLEQIEEEHPAVQRIVNEQELGTKPIPVPVYHYHGLEDEFVPVTQDVALHHAWCSLGVKDDLQLYPGDHLLTDPTAISNVMKWISERLAGKPAPSTCGLHSPSAPLPSSARLTKETGELVIPLPAWRLSGTVTEASSGISIEVPAGSTLSAEGDVTTGKLKAILVIPPIDQTVSLDGIPVTVRGALTPVGTITGTVGPSNSGVFSESAVGEANELVSSVGVGIFTVPIGCTTVSPIKLPLSISEPVNALVTGGFAIKTEVTVPEFGGCGLFGPVLTATMSGPDNPINMTATPPPPIPW